MRADAAKIVTEAADYAKKNGKSRITATGHADTSGTPQYNLALSERRAKAIKASLIKLGFKVIATRGTQKVLAGLGIPVEIVNKVAEGRPHCVDGMISGQVQLVVNTTEGAQSLKDSFTIRRTALTRNICHYTTLAGAEAAVAAIGALKDGALDVAPLQSYFKR